MSTIAPTQSAPPLWMPSPVDVYRLTVDQYDRMVESGALGEDAPIELLGGILVTKMPKNPRHMWSVEAARDAVSGLLPPGWSIRQKGPVRVPNFDELEPDLAVIRGTRDDYQDRHPGPGNVSLIVEVAESSLARGRGEKLAAYGRGGIPVYWIINLIDRQLEVHSNPADRVYPAPTFLKERDSVELVIEGRVVGRIAVADMLPRP